ncbi:hypothetical protein B0T21DRAFT_344761 [Apiosordaria backusii]|uniref:PNPLA domain-containing protein n=1 Tax=Apiosordaria backusii TaxID=314023 RepID=A0AA40ESF1_9PEZI|nr:hypothetical protein B0T21DRAFT_344761 [Apiosordaria backusii]
MGLKFFHPITGVSGDSTPTTGDVQLYPDPGTRRSQVPLLFADYEGLDSGEKTPMGLKQKDDEWRRQRTAHNHHQSTLAALLRYATVTFVPLPEKLYFGRMDQQVTRLYDAIATNCNKSFETKREKRMAPNAENMDHMLSCAFDHFSQKPDDPFDFLSQALKRNPIQVTFAGNMLQFILIFQRTGSDGDIRHDSTTLLDALVPVISSCILLDAERHGIMTHGKKRHQRPDGKLFGFGCFESNFKPGDFFARWLKKIQQELDRLNAQLSCHQSERGMKYLTKTAIAARIHRNQMDTFSSPHREPQPFQIRVKPPFAGLRILFLDGTGGIVALGAFVNNQPVSKCITDFKELCPVAFTPRELSRVPGLRTAAMVSYGSEYKSRPFEALLHRTFASDKMASYAFIREDAPQHNVKIWEAARATSAAFPYFKTLVKRETGRDFCDGGLYHNCPVKVAFNERRFLWDDCQTIWDEFVKESTESVRGNRESTSRYLRLNVEVPTGVPKLNETKRVRELENLVLSQGIPNIKEVAHSSLPAPSTADSCPRYG